MSDINDDLKDLFKNINENRPEPEMPTAKEIYDKYENTFFPAPRRNKLKIMFAAAPLALASLAIVATVIILSNSNTSRLGEQPANSNGTEATDQVGPSAKPSNMTMPSGGVQPSQADSKKPSASSSPVYNRLLYVNVYSQVLETLNNIDNSLSANYVASNDNKKVSDYSKLNIVRAYISFAKLLYGNDLFLVTDSVIKFNCSYSDNNIIYQENLMYLKTQFNALDNYFSYELSGNIIENNNVNYDFYLYLSVDYNYDFYTINSYNLYFLNDSNALVLYKYENNGLYETNTPSDDIINYSIQARDKFYIETSGSDSIGDFSNEYKESIDSELGKDYFIN